MNVLKCLQNKILCSWLNENTVCNNIFEHQNHYHIANWDFAITTSSLSLFCGCLYSYRALRLYSFHTDNAKAFQMYTFLHMSAHKRPAVTRLKAPCMCICTAQSRYDASVGLHIYCLVRPAAASDNGWYVACVCARAVESQNKSYT